MSLALNTSTGVRSSRKVSRGVGRFISALDAPALLTSLLPEIGVRGKELVASLGLNREVVLILREIGARFFVGDEGSLSYKCILFTARGSSSRECRVSWARNLDVERPCTNDRG